MKILLTGSNGLVGTYLQRAFAQAGHHVLATTHSQPTTHNPQPTTHNPQPTTHNSQPTTHNPQPTTRNQPMDITDAMSVRETVLAFSPDWIIHCAAWAQPDQCETQPVECWNTNVTATRFLLHAAMDVGSKFLLLSTDFVFDGSSGPYAETDETGPINYYGCSKLAAEKAVLEMDAKALVIRTVLVYGQSPTVTRFNLLTWVRDKLKAGENIRVVSDQFRTPTYAGDLADGILKAVEKGASGIYHISGAEYMSPYNMAIAVAESLDLDQSLIEKVDASTFSQPALRPVRTGFIIDKARKELGYMPRSFKDGLLQMLKHDNP